MVIYQSFEQNLSYFLAQLSQRQRCLDDRSGVNCDVYVHVTRSQLELKRARCKISNKGYLSLNICVILCHNINLILLQPLPTPRVGREPVADLGGKGVIPPSPALFKVAKKRWSPRVAASFASHVSPAPNFDKFLDLLLMVPKNSRLELRSE